MIYFLCSLKNSIARNISEACCRSCKENNFTAGVDIWSNIEGGGGRQTYCFDKMIVLNFQLF